MHWSEFIGGHVVISPPYAWQRRYKVGDIEVTPRMNKAVDPMIVDMLLKKFPDIQRAYNVNELFYEEFNFFGSARRTLRGFIAAGAELNGIIRDVMIPNPDTE